MPQTGRVQYLQVHRRPKRPLLVANVYAHVDNPVRRNELLKTDFVMLGDFNCTCEEGGMAWLLANGVVYNFNESMNHFEPTRHPGHR